MRRQRRDSFVGVVASCLMAASCTQHVPAPLCAQKAWRFVEHQTESAAFRLESAVGYRSRRDPIVATPLGFVSRCQLLQGTAEGKIVAVWLEEEWPQGTRQVIAGRSLTRTGEEASVTSRRHLRTELARNLTSMCQDLAKLPERCGATERNDAVVVATGVALGERTLIMESDTSDLGTRLGLLVLLLAAYSEGRVGSSEVALTVDEVKSVLKSER